MQVKPLLAWHQDTFAHLTEQLARGRLPHALIVSGPSITGKFEFARSLAARVFCTGAGGVAGGLLPEPESTMPANQACGDCPACQLFAASTHPDYYELTPVESAQIKIDQVRELLGWMQGTPQRGGFRVVVVKPAHAMNNNSANALLKGLEEPGRDTLLLLVSDQPARMLPTVRSRCQVVYPGLPTAAEALEWLNRLQGDRLRGDQTVAALLGISGGNPLAVARGLEEGYFSRRQAALTLLSQLEAGAGAVETGAELARLPPLEVLNLLASVVLDATRAALTQTQAYCENADCPDLVRKLAEGRSAASLSGLSGVIERAREALLSTSNPNVQSLLEDLLIQWQPGQSS